MNEDSQRNMDGFMSETIFLSEANTMVTSMRITCNHLTIPINKIKRHYVNFRVETMVVSVALLALSLVGTCMAFAVPLGGLGFLALMFTVLAFAWFRKEYANYVELFIATEGRRIKILSASADDREVVYKIDDAITRARGRCDDFGGNLNQSHMRVFPTDTTIFKKIVLAND